MGRKQAYVPHECEWSTVSARRPCSICAGIDACHRETDGAFARCTRSPSDWPIVGGGWLHRIQSEVSEIAGDELGLAALESGALPYPGPTGPAARDIQ